MENKSLLNVKQVSTLLGVNTFTVYAWVHRKYIPFVKLSRVVRFRLSDIEKWISDKSAVPVEKANPTRKSRVSKKVISRDNVHALVEKAKKEAFNL